MLEAALPRTAARCGGADLLVGAVPRPVPDARWWWASNLEGFVVAATAARIASRTEIPGRLDKQFWINCRSAAGRSARSRDEEVADRVSLPGASSLAILLGSGAFGAAGRMAASPNAGTAIASTRIRNDPATQAYVTRRTAQGKSPREIQRCLKRYIARQLYRALTAAMPPNLAASA